MTWTWVICGAGRGVGKTRLAQGLCQILPNAVYAKQGCSPRRPDGPPNYFESDKELASFLDACRDRCEHLVVESNELARQGAADLIIFLEGVPGQTDYRDDADVLRSRAHLRVGPRATTDEWKEVLARKLPSAALCDAVCRLLAEHARTSPATPGAIEQVEALRISTGDGRAVRESCDVAVEDTLTIQVQGVGSFTLLCTPCDAEALALGFAFSEGMITSIDDVLACNYRPDQRTVGLHLATGQADSRRSLIVTSSCGLCGSRNVEALLAGPMASGDSLRVPAAVLRTVTERMRAYQELFRRTGGTHAAAIFGADGSFLAVAEDLGRHNALDKAIGKCLLEGLGLAGRSVVLSGRVSLELVGKAARAGLELVVAVSAPSSLAIQAAERCNLTLCGFVRGEHATVYTHPHRIVELTSPEAGVAP